MVVSMMDLTTLEGKDTPGKVAYLCRKAIQPAMRATACRVVRRFACIQIWCAPRRMFLGDSAVHVASVATAFPSGQMPLALKLEDMRLAVADGADEIDMVIDRGAFLAGEYARVADEIAAVKEACGAAHLKVIFETGELETYDNVRFAATSRCAPARISSRPAPAKLRPPPRCRSRS